MPIDSIVRLPFNAGKSDLPTTPVWGENLVARCTPRNSERRGERDTSIRMGQEHTPENKHEHRATGSRDRRSGRHVCYPVVLGKGERVMAESGDAKNKDKKEPKQAKPVEPYEKPTVVRIRRVVAAGGHKV